MAHVQQLFDHINRNFRDTYKSGVWVKTYITGIARNKAGNVFFECIDAMKFDKKKPYAKVIFKLKNHDNLSFTELCHKLEVNPTLPEKVLFKPGQLYTSFKVVPMIHYERGLMPLVQDIEIDDDHVGIENMRSGLRIGIENKILNKPENNMKPWTDAHKTELQQLVSNTNLGIESIGIRLKRTPIACVEMIGQLSLLDAKTLSEWRKIAIELQEKNET